MATRSQHKHFSELTADLHARMREAMVRLFPNASVTELKLKFIQAMYGHQLADQVRAWLNDPKEGTARTLKWERSDQYFVAAKREVEFAERAEVQAG